MVARSRDQLLGIARRYIRRHVRRLARTLPEISKATDPEAIHQARVACRRLRAGLRIFARLIGQQRTRRWRKSIRQLARNLGEARDLDVQIQATTEHLASLTDVSLLPGAVYWLVRLERQRRKIQPRIRGAVRRFLRDNVLRQVRRWATDQSAPNDGDFSEEPGSDSLKESPVAGAIELLQERLTAFRLAAHSLADPDDKEGHHLFRVRAKKFRYALEASLPALGDATEVALEALKEIQHLAGTVHDCDVWSAQLEVTLRRVENGKPPRPRWLNPPRLLPGLVALAEHYRQLRIKTFQQLRELFSEPRLTILWNFLESSQFLGDVSNLKAESLVFTRSQDAPGMG